MDAWSTSLRSSKPARLPQKVSFMPSPGRKRSLSKASLSGSSPVTPKKSCLEKVRASSRNSVMNTTFITSRNDAVNRTFITSRRETADCSSASQGLAINDVEKAFITSRRETADQDSALRKRQSDIKTSTPVTLYPSSERLSHQAKISLGFHSSLGSRSKKSETFLEKDICAKVDDLEKQLELYIQSSKAAVEELEKKNEIRAKETKLLRYRMDQLEKSNVFDPTAVEDNVRTREELDNVESLLNTKTLELESLRKSYERLEGEHLALRRLMDVKEAENRMLEDLLEIEREKSKKSEEELDFAVQENEMIKKKMLEYESRMVALHNEVLELKGNIRVFVRVRPLPRGELKSCLSVNSQTSLTVSKLCSRDGSTATLPYRFDRVLDTSASQKEVFGEVQQLVVSALDGFNVCVIAYGQTGSGKTYTMEGPQGANPNDVDDERIGVIPRAFSELFDLIRDRKDQDWVYNIHVSMLEIYNEMILDLLNKHTECNIRIAASDSNRTEILQLENVSSVLVTDRSQATKLFEKARTQRKVGTTKCNGRSSRSHCVLRVHVKARNSSSGAERESVLNLVDLAGSERVKQSEVEGIRLTESRKINSSLTQLLTVIMSLGNKAAHIPYRNSKLTHLLSTSLGNNAKALMIVHVSPAQIDVSETINSLRFAQKVNEVHIGPRNDSTKDKSHG